MNISHRIVLLFTCVPVLAQTPNAESPQPKGKGTIEGRVLGPLGTPLPNVEVVATHDPRGTAVLAKSRTDGDGMFVIGRLPTDRGCSVLARLPGHTTAVEYASLGPTTPQAGLELRLWTANTLRGRVVDPQGKPVVDAVVLGTKDCTRLDGGFLAPEARTDANGLFELPGVPIGDCVVRVWKPGFELREHELVALADTALEVQIAPGDGTQLAIYAKGLPEELLAQTVVRITATRGEGFSLPSAIEQNGLDAGGRCNLKGLPNAQWRVELEAPGCSFEPRNARTKEGRFVNVLPFAARAGGDVTLRGTLRSTDGKPLAGQTLVSRMQRSQPLSSIRPGRATTDAEGRFVLETPLVRDEPYSLSLIDSTWALQHPTGNVLSHELRYGMRWQEKADPDRELALIAAPAALVTARLVDPDGQPVPFVRTELQGYRSNVEPAWGVMATATSRRDGTLEFPCVAPEFDLRVHAAGNGGSGDSEAFLLETGKRHHVQVVLQRPGTVRGRVVDAAGKPVAGSRVALTNMSPVTGQQTDGGRLNVLCDHKGRFVFTGVSPGGHRAETDNQAATGKGVGEIFEVAAGAIVSVEVRLSR